MRTMMSAPCSTVWIPVLPFRSVLVTPGSTALITIGAGGTPEVARKIADHPQVGPMTLDCDVLPVAGADLRIMIYSAEPGTEDAELLALLAVVGMQTLLTGP
jgi:MmyB-like transcription regulator ligand binding domain